LKRFFFTIIILGAAAYCFFQGWVQFHLPAGSFAVLRSKTHGVDSRVIREGEFRWVWYKLLPTNVTVQTYQLKEIAVPVKVKGSLLSADTYAAFAGVKADFSFEFDGTVFCSPRPSSLPDLVKNHIINSQEDLNARQERVSREIENVIRERLWSYAGQESILEEARVKGRISVLERELAEAFPDMADWNCSITTLHVPDLALYTDIKALHEDYLAAQKKLLEDDISAAAGKSIASRQRFDELALYGELLTKYPVLLNYLALEKGLPFK
jgi:hypothetical protein